MCWLSTRAWRIKPVGQLSTHEVKELMNNVNLTRRHVLSGAAGVAAATVAGCIGGEDDGDEQFDGPPEQRDAYVVAYHWGYAAYDEDGQELDVIEISPNTELTIHAVNDHAYDAFDSVPDPVAAELEDFDGLARLKAKVEAGDLPEPSGEQSVEDVYEAAHGHGHDDDDGHHGDDHHDGDDHGHGEDGGHHEDDGHGHDDDGHGHHGDDGHGHGEGEDHHEDDGHGHDDGMLDHGFRLIDLDFEVPADATEPTTGSTVFEEPGTYQASCTVPCGEYHGYQREDIVHVTE